MELGLSNNPKHMLNALKRQFFNAQPAHVAEAFVDDLPIVVTWPHNPITLAEISDALQPISNKSAPGPSGHNYKLVKWAFAADPTHFQALFEACLTIGHHPRA
jgi:hypothetical protein